MDKTLPSGVSIVDSSEATGLVPSLSLNVANLDRAKRGDFIRLLVKFKIPATSETPENPKATEFVTCLVAAKTPNGLIKAKVFSRPEMTYCHSLTYGDDLTVAERYVLTHEVSDVKQAAEVEHVLTGVIPEAQPINAEDAKLRAAVRDFPPLQPEMGGEYWLRNGVRVRVWGFHAGVWVGGVPIQGMATLEWTALGAHAGGNRDLDIVKDIRASEVVYGK